MSAPKDGRPTGVKGVIKRSDIAAGLGLGGPEELKRPEAGTGRPMETPAQARARVEGKPVPPDAPGFTRTVVPGGRDAAEYLGAPVGVPLGEGAEGMPLEPEPLSREEEAKRIQSSRQRTDWEKIDRQRASRQLAETMADLRRRIENLLRKEAGLTK
jgi:hypothetical protein